MGKIKLPGFGGRGSKPSTPHGKSPRRRGLRPDIDLNFQLPDIKLPKPSNDNVPQTVNNTMGSFARAGRSPGSPTGVMPNFRRESASPVSGRDSVEKILSTATQYLASIDASLKAQVQQQQYAYNQGQKQQRENAAERGGGFNLGSSWIGQKAGNLASVAKEEMWNLTKVLGGLGLLYTYLNFDELEEKFSNVIEEAKESATDYLIAGGAIGAAVLGKKAYAAYKRRKMRKQAADTMLGLYPDEISKLGTKEGAPTTKLGKLRHVAGTGGKILKGVGWGLVANTVLDVLPTILGIDPNGRMSAALNIGSSIATGAGLGSIFGVPGAIVGGVLGGAVGLWNYGKQLWTGKPSNTPQNTPSAPQEAYDIVYGNGLFGDPERDKGKKLTQMTLAEVLDFQRTVLTPHTKGNYAGGNDGQKHTPVGAYQFTEETLVDLMKSGNGNPQDIFNKVAQDRMAEALWNQRRGGDLSKTWAWTAGTSSGQFANTPFSDVKDSIISREVGSYVGMPVAALAAQQSTPTGGHTFESAKAMFQKFDKLRDKMRLMPYREGTTSSEQIASTKFLAEHAKMRETYMRGKERLQQIVSKQESTAAANKYASARHRRSDFRPVPDPTYDRESPLHMLTYFNVGNVRMTA